MAWLAVDLHDGEIISPVMPCKYDCGYDCSQHQYMNDDEGYIDMRIILPKGSIKKLIGRELTWDDEPVEI